MIERVAFRLVNRRRAQHDIPLLDSVESMNKNLILESLIEYREQAISAIEEMRDAWRYAPNGTCKQEDFERVINAVLKE